MYYSVGWPNKCSVGIYCRVWPRRGGLPPYNVRNHPALWLHTCQSMIPTWMRMAKIEISSGWWGKGFGSQNLNKSKQVLTACLVLWNEDPDLAINFSLDRQHCNGDDDVDDLISSPSWCLSIYAMLYRPAAPRRPLLSNAACRGVCFTLLFN